MILYSFLVAIFQCGSRHAASYMAMNSTDFSAIVTGMFFLVVIASEFFVNYKIMLKGKENNNEPVLAAVPNIDLANSEEQLEQIEEVSRDEAIENSEQPVEEPQKEKKPAKKVDNKKKTAPKKSKKEAK